MLFVMVYDHNASLNYSENIGSLVLLVIIVGLNCMFKQISLGQIIGTQIDQLVKTP